ncbi:MAG: YfhO family protein [Eubacterium sp.]|nr:YfhO family protein [Eubacterium sp.]
MKAKLTSKTGKRTVLLIGAFVIPILIFLAVMIVMGFYPWGEKTTLYMDLRDQYSEFLGSLKYLNEPDSSLLFSWSRSMGGNAVGLYAYYGGGLLSFLVWLVPVSKIYLAVALIQIIGVGLCGLSFALYLEFGIAEKKTRLSFLVFSTCYALMSYFIVYIGCYMWITGGIFMPLIMLGIEKILVGKKGLLLYIFLTLAMCSNYYTAYMICLFSIMYFVLRVITVHEWSKTARKQSFKKAGIATAKYAGAGLLSAMTSLPVLLPTYIDLASGKLDMAGGEVAGTNFPFSNVFYKLLPFQYDSITNENSYPSIYAGTVVLIFAVFYFLQRKRTLREKLISLAILGAMFASFYFKKLDCVWHGFLMPTWFPYRYAFVFGFFLVFLGFRAYEKWEPDKSRLPIIVPSVLLVVSSVELFFNTKVCMTGIGDQFGYMEVAGYNDFYDRTEPLVSQVKESDSSWFRMDKDYEFSKNDSMLLGYRGMTHYSSTYNTFVDMLTYRLGLAQTVIWNSGYGATPLVDSLFGVKYRLATKTMPETYTAIGQNRDVTLYENPYQLPACFAADAGVVGSDMPASDVFSNQNEILSDIIGQETLCMKPVEYFREDIENETKLTLTSPGDQPMFLYMQPESFNWGDIYVNDQFVSNYFSSETTCAVYLGHFPEGEPVTISVRSNGAVILNAWVVCMDQSVFENSMQIIRSQAMNTENFGAGSMEGTIHVEEGQVVASSIPYDEGYSVWVDDEEVSPEKWLDTFLCIPVDAGDHRIRISFRPQGLGLGCLIMGITLLIVISVGTISMIRRKVSSRHKALETEKRNEKI